MLHLRHRLLPLVISENEPSVYFVWHSVYSDVEVERITRSLATSPHATLHSHANSRKLRIS